LKSIFVTHYTRYHWIGDFIMHPTLLAQFVKETGHKNKEIVYATVKLIQVDEYAYEIIQGTIYEWDFLNGGQLLSYQQKITCQFPATAKWIYDKCVDIYDCCNSGNVVKNIPFIVE